MLQRFEPFNDLRQMQDTMDRLWRRFGNGSAASSDSPHAEAWAVPLDVVRNGEDTVIRASMPGVSPEDIQVSIEDSVLTIKGQTSQEHQEGDGNYLMRERRSGAFHRALRLPDSVDAEKAHPFYQNGVLTITIPRAEAKRARQLPVQVGETSTKVGD